LNVLLGSMSADDGADALAQHYRHTAAQLASEAEDLAFFVIALCTMSAHAHDLGHDAPAVPSPEPSRFQDLIKRLSKPARRRRS